MADLTTIIQNAQCEPDIFSFIKRQAVGILTHLGMGDAQADKWITDHIENKKLKAGELTDWEKKLYDNLHTFGLYKNLDQKMTERAKAWFDKINPYLLKTKTLDLGGGSGEVANLMQSFGCDVTIADVINWNRFNLPFAVVRENKVDVKENAFNQVVLLTVFHHTNDVLALIKETFRVAKKRVIFIESVTENLIGYTYGAWIDWFYNRVIHYSSDVSKKINVPCNFLPATGWEQLVWKLTGLKPVVSENIGIYQYLNPENHHLFMYDIK